MNSRYTIIFLFVLFFTGHLFSQDNQEWAWRNIEYWDLETRILNHTDYPFYNFNAEADFRESHFNSSADFTMATFSSTADFGASIFNDTADFSSAKFHSAAIFEDVEFTGMASFLMARFDSSANLAGARFHSKVFFDYCKFDSLADFGQTEFKGEISLLGDTLPKFLNFSKTTRISNEIDLTQSIINPEYDSCYINLTNAAIDKFRFRYKRFKLWFPKEDSVGYELKTNVYEDLLLMQKREGFTQSYEILDKEYKAFQYTDPDGDYSWFWGHALNFVDKHWWGYGYNKECIIVNVFIIFLVFSFINSFFLRFLNTQVYTIDNIKNLLAVQKNRSPLYRWFAYLRYSFFYTAVIFFSFKFNMDNLHYSRNLDGFKVLNLFYFLTLYLGGLICLAYLANYIITV